MAKLLNEVNWEAEFEGKCVQEKWNLFKTKLEEISNLCIPMSKPRRYVAPWMNIKVVRAYKKKYFAWKRYMESPSNNKWQRYATDRNKANKTERDERRAYEKRLTDEIRTNRKGFFK